MQQVSRTIASFLICGAALIGWQDSAAVPPPIIPVPPGYGHYCSITYTGGGWSFATLTGSSSDPCGWLRTQTPGGTIQRAGLWSENGLNNVMVRCNGDLRMYRGRGSSVLALAYGNSAGKRNCTFVVAPVQLPIFGRPYCSGVLLRNWADSNSWDCLTDWLVEAMISQDPSGFNYNEFNEAWDVSKFGQTQDPAVPARYVDRYGQQQCKVPNTPPCKAFEGAYDWNMPMWTSIVAVAPGVVRGAASRDVTYFKCKMSDSKYQNEVFIEHQVGSGLYAERFVTGYHHMDSIEVKVDQVVGKGTRIGPNGSTGCSTGPHLDFSVFRLTNLSGARSYNFATTPSGYGVNGIQGVIDPFGWAAPKNVDPWAWKSLGVKDPNFLGDPTHFTDFPAGVSDAGAFSINLWLPEETPPIAWP